MTSYRVAAMYGAIQPEEVVCVIQLFRSYLRS